MNQEVNRPAMIGIIVAVLILLGAAGYFMFGRQTTQVSDAQQERNRQLMPKPGGAALGAPRMGAPQMMPAGGPPTMRPPGAPGGPPMMQPPGGAPMMQPPGGAPMMQPPAGGAPPMSPPR